MVRVFLKASMKKKPMQNAIVFEKPKCEIKKKNKTKYAYLF